MGKKRLRGAYRRAARMLATAGCAALAACAGGRTAHPSVPDAIPMNPPPTYATREVDPRMENICQVDPTACPQIQSASASGEILLTGQLTSAPAVRKAHAESLILAVAQRTTGGARPPRSPPTPLPAGQRPDQAVTLVDVEAHLGIEVDGIPDATARV